MAFDNSPLQVVGKLFVIKTTTTNSEGTTNGFFARLLTNSEQNPNDWSDFSEFCPEPEGQVTTMEILKNKKAEIIISLQPVDSDGLMDNFGNEYVAIESVED